MKLHVLINKFGRPGTYCCRAGLRLIWRRWGIGGGLIRKWRPYRRWGFFFIGWPFPGSVQWQIRIGTFIISVKPPVKPVSPVFAS